MKTRYLLGLLLLCACCGGAGAQGMMSDVMSGKLVNPQVGAFAWYNLRDDTTGKEYFLRQAIVGEERVKRKDAYWLETELIPKVGFPSVYKMLLTGPASDPDNVHRLLVREGAGAVQEISIDVEKGKGEVEEVPRKLVGVETIELPGGNVEAEHYTFEENGQKSELWISEQVPPMGLVKMTTAQGQMTLQRYGVGGKDGESAIPSPAADGKGDEKGEKKVEGQGEGVKEPAPSRGGNVRTNFGGRKKGK